MTLPALCRCALLSALLCAASARAEDLTPDTTRYLSDPSFLTLRGQFISVTSYEYSRRTSDLQNPYGLHTEHLVVDRNAITESLGYGISNRFEAGILLTYSEASQHLTYPVAPGQDLDVNEFDNPTLFAIYRAFVVPADGFSVDVEGTFTPALFSNQGGAGSVALYVNQEYRSLTVQGEIGGGYNASYSTIHTLNGLAANVGDQTDYLVALRSQFRLTARWSTTVGIVYERDNSYTVYHPPSGAQVGYGAQGSIDPYAVLGYDIVPNRINLAVEYDYYSYNNQTLSPNIGSFVNQSRKYCRAPARAVLAVVLGRAAAGRSVRSARRSRSVRADVVAQAQDQGASESIGASQ